MLVRVFQLGEEPPDDLRETTTAEERIEMIVALSARMLELTQHILALRADLPVILCSGFSDKLDTAAAMSLGIRRYFDKPVNNRVLMQALDEVLHA